MAAYLDLSASPPVTAADVAALRAGTPDRFKAGQIATLTGAGATFRKMYGWDPTELAADDGDTVIKPDATGGGSPGRRKVLATAAALASTLVLRDSSGGFPLDTSARVVHVNKLTGANDPVPSDICGISVRRGAVAGVQRDYAGLFWEEINSRWLACLDTLGDDTGLGAPTVFGASELHVLNASRVQQLRAYVAGGGVRIDAAAAASAFNLGYAGAAAAGDGAGFTLSGQAGAPGPNKGGPVTFIGGSPGDATVTSGDVVAELGAPNATRTGGFKLSYDGDVYFDSYFAVAGGYQRVDSAAPGGIYIQSTVGIAWLRAQTTAGFESATGGGLSGLANVISVAAPTMTVINSKASFTLQHAQDSSAAGGAMTVRAQRGFAGFIGGDFIWGPGDGGTLGTNAPGMARLKLGTPVGGQSGIFRGEREDGTQLWNLSETSATNVTLFFGASPGSANGIIRGNSLNLESNVAHVAITSPQDVYIGHGATRDLFLRESGVLALTMQLRSAGLTSLVFANTVTGALLAIASTTNAIGVNIEMTGQSSTHAAGTGGLASVTGGAGTARGGHALLTGGAGTTNGGGGLAVVRGGAKAGTGLDGNVALHTLPGVVSTWGERVTIWGAAASEPTANPASGLAYLWASAGIGTLTSVQMRAREPGGVIDGYTYFTNRATAPTGHRHFKIEDGRLVSVTTANQLIGVIPSAFFSSGTWVATIVLVIQAYDENAGNVRELITFTAERRAGSTTLSAVEVIGTGVDSAGQNPTFTVLLSGADINVRVTQAKAENTHWSIWGDVYFNEQ